MAKKEPKCLIPELHQQGELAFSLFLVDNPSLDGVSSTGQVKCISLIIFSFEKKWLRWRKKGNILHSNDFCASLMVFLYASFYPFFYKNSGYAC